MFKTVRISDFLHRKHVSQPLEPDVTYSLVTVKLHHKGVVLREKKLGGLIKSSMYRVSKGDFILSGIDARNGAFGIVPEALDGAVVTNDFWYFDVDEAIIKRDFFYWLTTTPLFLDACIKSSRGETQRIRLQKDLFFNFELQLPSPEEQEIYLKRFQTVDAIGVNLQEELAKQSTYLSQLRQTILQEAIEGKLTTGWRGQHPMQPGDPQTDAAALLAQIQAEKARLIAQKQLRPEQPLPPIREEEIPFALPVGWVWCRLGEISQIKGGKRVANGYKMQKEPTPYIYIRVSDMQNGTISDDDLHYIDEDMYKKIKQYTISKDDLYMTIVGATIGKCGIVPEKFDGMNLTENAAKIVIYYLNKTYLLNVLSSPLCQEQFIDRTKQVAVQKMALNRLSTALIPLPPLAEQRTIVERVDRLLALVDELAAQVAERKAQADALMQAVLREAFAG